MIAAIYAARARIRGSRPSLCGRERWTVAEEHVYADDGISGAEFRPGPPPTFRVLIMSEEWRLGREQIQTDYALRQIMDSSVAAEWITVEVPALRMTPSSKGNPGRLIRRSPSW
jgi:hypothetical protein